MYRSSSTTRFSDEFSALSSSTPPPSALPHQNHPAGIDPLLPTYNPQSHVAKKEKYRIRSAESAIHFIPFLLLLCAIILWFFSSPVEMSSKDDSFISKVADSIADSANHTSTG